MRQTTVTEADRAAELHGLIRSGEAQHIREQSGLTLAMVGRSIGVDRSVMSRWEKGDRRPTGHAAVDYLRLLRRLASRQQATN